MASILGRETLVKCDIGSCGLVLHLEVLDFQFVKLSGMLPSVNCCFLPLYISWAAQCDL